MAWGEASGSGRGDGPAGGHGRTGEHGRWGTTARRQAGWGASGVAVAALLGALAGTLGHPPVPWPRRWAVDRGGEGLLALDLDALPRGRVRVPCPVLAMGDGARLWVVGALEGRAAGAHALWVLEDAAPAARLPPGTERGSLHPLPVRGSMPAPRAVVPDGEGGAWVLGGEGGLVRLRVRPSAGPTRGPVAGGGGGAADGSAPGSPSTEGPPRPARDVWVAGPVVPHPRARWAVGADPGGERRGRDPGSGPGGRRALLLGGGHRVWTVDGRGCERARSHELPGEALAAAPGPAGGWWVGCRDPADGAGLLVGLGPDLEPRFARRLGEAPARLAAEPDGGVTWAPVDGPWVERRGPDGAVRGRWSLEDAPVEALLWVAGPGGPELWVACPGALLRRDGAGRPLPGQGGFRHLVGLTLGGPRGP